MDFLVHRLYSFSWIYLYQKTIRTNIRIYSYKKWYKLISEYICIKKMIRTNIRIYSYKKNDTNIWYERIFVSENIQIYLNIRIFVTPCPDPYFPKSLSWWWWWWWWWRRMRKALLQWTVPHCESSWEEKLRLSSNSKCQGSQVAPWSPSS